MSDFTVYSFPQYRKALAAFLATYTIDSVAMSPAQKMSGLKPKKERTCRFCGLNGTETSFSKDAHLLSTLLGNRYLLSDSECNACNEKFSRYEDDLAKFLGISRTVLRVSAKNKVPTFHSSDNLVSARQTAFNGIQDGVKIERYSTDNEAFRVLDDQGRVEITTRKDPYVPARVYKAFLKMALSAMPEAEMKSYARAVKILMSDAYDEKCSSMFKLFHHQLPSNYVEKRPHCFVFRKLSPKTRQLSHQFYLRYQNNVYILLVPFSLEDIMLGLYDEKRIATTFAPPILFSEPQTGIHCVSEIRDLSSTKVYREEEVLTFQMEPNAMKNAQIVNQDTGEVISGDFEPKDVIGIYIAPIGSTLKFPQASAE
jgi:hypothetical protein